MELGTVDTLLPQTSVLGGILLDPRKMGEAAQILTDEDFTAPNCRILWCALKAIFRTGRQIDPILAADQLRGYDGARALIAACMEAAPLPSNFTAHLDALKRQARLERLREIGRQLIDAADLDEAAELLDAANRASINLSARERRTWEQMLESFAKRHASTEQPAYIPWPFGFMRQGLHFAKGKYIILGGYPSDGKTALALNCALYQAAAFYTVRFYSLETDADTVEDRAIAAEANISLERIQKNALLDSEWEGYAKTRGSSGINFEVVNASNMTVDDIRADALACHADIIYVDYLGLISAGRQSKYASRFEVVTSISMGLQQLAKSTGITVIALCQLTRPATGSGEPTMHSLRESGQIEQDADCVMLVYREDPTDLRSLRKLNIAKNKEGRTGKFPLDFNGEYQRFSDKIPIEKMAGMKSKMSNRRAGDKTKKTESAADPDQLDINKMEAQTNANNDHP